jgi:diguanylate cyclase (GGDEF)-like protein
MRQVMGPLGLNTTEKRARAVRFAIAGNVLPVAVASATNLASHRLLFFIGAAGACIAPLVVTLVSRRHRLLFYVAAFGGIPALTLMQAYTGGAASGYSVLVLMATIWFGLMATDGELLVGALVLTACSFLPMLVVGAPAYPVDWGHATLLVLVGCSVAGTLRALTVETQRLTRKLQQDAVIDDLTGLLNRRGWRYMAPGELVHAARGENGVVLVTIDLDDFKALNDRSGHGEGDRVLRETAARIQETFRGGDIVARLGGDEFIVLVVDSTLPGAINAINRLRLMTPADGGFSAGVAAWDGIEDLNDLMRRSDLALYAAKATHSGTHIAPPLPGRWLQGGPPPGSWRRRQAPARHSA